MVEDIEKSPSEQKCQKCQKKVANGAKDKSSIFPEHISTFRTVLENPSIAQNVVACSRKLSSTLMALAPPTFIHLPTTLQSKHTCKHEEKRAVKGIGDTSVKPHFRWNYIKYFLQSGKKMCIFNAVAIRQSTFFRFKSFISN